jgi:hypothetical protein
MFPAIAMRTAVSNGRKESSTCCLSIGNNCITSALERLFASAYGSATPVSFTMARKYSLEIPLSNSAQNLRGPAEEGRVIA